MFFFISLCHFLHYSSMRRTCFSFVMIFAHTWFGKLFYFNWLQRNNKREVDNTQKIYLIDAVLENLSHVTDD